MQLHLNAITVNCMFQTNLILYRHDCVLVDWIFLIFPTVYLKTIRSLEVPDQDIEDQKT